MRRDLTITALSLLALIQSTQIGAEVRVVTSRTGSYEMTRVSLDARTGSVWSSNRRGATATATTLNSNGDRNGDLHPALLECPLAPHYPWAVWSRLQNGRYDLAWSRWTDRGAWEPIRWLEPEYQGAWDNLDADLGFDEAGRPYVVWWRHELEGGRVFLSVYLSDSWMTAYAVSDPGIDSRYPTIEVGPGSLVVYYDTPEGRVQQTILFNLPVTITDDINPLDYAYTSSKIYIE